MLIKKYLYAICIIHACTTILTAHQSSISLEQKYAKPYDQQCRDAKCPKIEECWNHIKRQHANIISDKATLEQEKANVAPGWFWGSSNPTRLAQIDASLTNLTDMQKFILTENAKQCDVINIANKYAAQPKEKAAIVTALKKQHYASNRSFSDLEKEIRQDFRRLTNLNITPEQYPNLATTAQATQDQIYVMLDSVNSLYHEEQKRKDEHDLHLEKKRTEQKQQLQIDEARQQSRDNFENQQAAREKQLRLEAERNEAIKTAIATIYSLNLDATIKLSKHDFTRLTDTINLIVRESEEERSTIYTLQDERKKIAADLKEVTRFRDLQDRLKQEEKERDDLKDGNTQLTTENTALINKLCQDIKLVYEIQIDPKNVLEYTKKLTTDIATADNQLQKLYKHLESLGQERTTLLAEQTTLQSLQTTAQEYLNKQNKLADLQRSYDATSDTIKTLQAAVETLRQSFKNRKSINPDQFEKERSGLQTSFEKMLQANQSAIATLSAMRIATNPKNSGTTLAVSKNEQPKNSDQEPAKTMPTTRSKN